MSCTNIASLPRKRFALYPPEREKVCVHEHAPYRGTIPCTGPLRCTLCGTLFADYKELNVARREARYLLEKDALKEKI